MKRGRLVHGVQSALLLPGMLVSTILSDRRRKSTIESADQLQSGFLLFGESLRSFAEDDLLESLCDLNLDIVSTVGMEHVAEALPLP